MGAVSLWGLALEVPADLITKPWEVTANRTLAEKNSEIRRVMIERMGMEKFISESGAKKIHATKWESFSLFFSVWRSR